MTVTDAAEHERLLSLVAADTIPFWSTLGVTVEEVHAPGHVTLGLPMAPHVANRRGKMHGGPIGSMIDAAGGSAVRTLQETGHESEIGTVTTDLNLTFLNPATGSITATGRVLRRSRSLAFVQVDVHDETGTHVATGRVSFALTSLR